MTEEYHLPVEPVESEGSAQQGAKNKFYVMIYSRFERLWHWSQAGLIFVLLFTGFSLHGSLPLMSFESAVFVHTLAAIALIVLWIFALFWHMTTGQWKQYAFKKGVLKVIRFYAYGILLGEPHPYKKGLQRKQNALQSIAYVGFALLIAPALWITGMAYLLYPLWEGVAGAQNLLSTIAYIHVASAFAIAIFIIIHVYMTTTGKTVFHYIHTMVTGYDKVELSSAEEAYLKETKSVPMKDC